MAYLAAGIVGQTTVDRAQPQSRQQPQQIQQVSSHHQREGNLYLVIDDVEGENTDSIHIFLVASSPKSPVIAECYKKC